MHSDSQACLQTSVRNCFAGRMTHIIRGGANDEIRLQLTGGECLTCLVTSERSLTLDLRVGAAAYALVNPTSIMLLAELPDAFKFSARNRFTAHIKQLRTGAENTEVTMVLQGGDALVALVSNLAAQALKLTEGQTVQAIFKATSVILGVAA